MRVKYQCSGGYANLSLGCDLDTEAMPLPRADALRRLVMQSGVFDLEVPALSCTSGGPPDVLQYDLSVADEDHGACSLSFNDVTIPTSLRPLLDWLLKQACSEP